MDPMTDTSELPYHAVKWTRKGVQMLLESSDLQTLKSAVEMSPLAPGEYVAIHNDWERIGTFNGEQWS